MKKIDSILILFISLTLMGCGMWGGGRDQNQTSPALGATTLSISVSSLALSVNCQPASSCTTTQSASLTGNPRQIIVTNTGSVRAENVAVASLGLPSGTNVIDDTCSAISLVPSASCTFTITPGSVATSSCEIGIAPTPGSVTVSADNASDVSSTVQVLTYGCIYQGGFLFAVDDTTLDTGSIGGKVVSLVDQAEPYISSGPQATSVVWTSNGGGADASHLSSDMIPGVDENSTTVAGSPTYSSFSSDFSTHYTNLNPFTSASFESCNGASDGKCNSTNILALYNIFTTNYGVGASPYTGTLATTNHAYYPAGLCSQSINTYSDWYLPSTCELDSITGSITCPAGQESILGTLAFLVGDVAAGTPSTSCSPPSGTNCLAGYYWSSTEASSNPALASWAELFTNGGSSPGGNIKSQAFGVRCVRSVSL